MFLSRDLYGIGVSGNGGTREFAIMQYGNLAGLRFKVARNLRVCDRSHAEFTAVPFRLCLITAVPFLSHQLMSVKQ